MLSFRRRFVLISHTLKSLKTRGTDGGIIAWRKKAQRAFPVLSLVQRSKDQCIAAKIRIFNTNIKAVLLYSSQIWRVTTISAKKVQTSIGECLRIENSEVMLAQSDHQQRSTCTMHGWEPVNGHALRHGETNIHFFLHRWMGTQRVHGNMADRELPGMEASRKIWWGPTSVGARPKLWLKTDRCGRQLYGCPMPPMGQRGPDDNDDTGVALIHNLSFRKHSHCYI